MYLRDGSAQTTDRVCCVCVCVGRGGWCVGYEGWEGERREEEREGERREGIGHDSTYPQVSMESYVCYGT